MSYMRKRLAVCPVPTPTTKTRWGSGCNSMGMCAANTWCVLRLSPCHQRSISRRSTSLLREMETGAVAGRHVDGVGIGDGKPGGRVGVPTLLIGPGQPDALGRQRFLQLAMTGVENALKVSLDHRMDAEQVVVDRGQSAAVFVDPGAKGTH